MLTLEITNGDIVLDDTGHPNTVSDGLKLNQDIAEMFTIRTQDNGFGAGLEDVIGNVDSSIGHTILLSSKLRDAVDALIRLQSSAIRPAEERVISLANVDVYPVNGATAFAFSVAIRTADDTTTTLSGAIAR